MKRGVGLSTKKRRRIGEKQISRVSKEYPPTAENIATSVLDPSTGVNAISFCVVGYYLRSFNSEQGAPWR